MHSPPFPARSGGFRGAFGGAEAWLDGKGKLAWIAAMVVAFVLFWPVGLALLAYMIWGKRMFSSSCAHRRSRDHAAHRTWGHADAPTGNAAFDSYKTEALRRLEEEQTAFEAFLQRLRSSKDKAEFDTFMEDRARSMTAEDATAPDTTADTLASAPKPERPGEY